MKAFLKNFLFWSPRVLGILFALFISLFALDVFSEGYGFGETVIALVMHLVPTMIIVVLLIIAWKREVIGGLLFIAIALFYILTSRGQSWIISGPVLLIGALFILGGFVKRA